MAEACCIDRDIVLYIKRKALSQQMVDFDEK